jgi:hypothetical protein
LNVTVYDIDDNNATDSIDLILDTTPPVTSISTDIGGRYIAAHTPIHLSVTDPAGIYMTQFKIDGGKWQDYTGPFTLGYNVGEHTIYYNSTDMVNNSETTKSYTVYIADDWTGGGPGSGSYKDQVYMGCNLTIDGKMVLENVTIIMNNTEFNMQWINVTGTGKLTIRNSTIFAYYPQYRTRFLVDGDLVMYQTTVRDLWAHPSTGVGGIELYNSTAHIILSKFYNVTGPAVYMEEVDAEIAGNEIKYAKYGIWAHRSAGDINTNIITNVETGIYITDGNSSTSNILNSNEIRNADFGIYCKDLFYADNDFRIYNQEFSDIADTAIFIEGSYPASSTLRIDNSTFENVNGSINVMGLVGPRIVIHDNDIKNMTGTNRGISAMYNDDVYIEHNTFTNTYGDVIYIWGNSNIAVVSNNDVTDGNGIRNVHEVITVRNGQGQIHINNNDITDVSNIGSILTRVNSNSTDSYVKNNNLNDNSFGGIRFFEYADDIYVENNVIESCGFSFWAQHIEQDTNDIITFKNNKIRNNTIIGMSIDNINNINIENNEISKTTGRGISLYNNVWGDLNIGDNDFLDNTGFGLYLFDPSIDLGDSIGDNVFINNNNGGRAIDTDFDPGVWNLSSKLVFLNNFPFFDGNNPQIVIKSGGNLSVSSTTIGNFGGITVESGGTIYAYDTTFTGPSGFNFDVYGRLILTSCTIWNANELYIEDPEYIYLAASLIRNNVNNGIHLKNANITISNILSRNNGQSGIYIEDCNPLIQLSEFRFNTAHGVSGDNFDGNITECEILGNGQDNVYMKNSDGILYYNLINGAGDDNIHLDYSTTTIKRNAIQAAGDYGIYLDHSNAHILFNLNVPKYSYRGVRSAVWIGAVNQLCQIVGSTNDGIYLYYSNPHIENNTIWGGAKNGISVISSGGHIEYNEIAWNTGSGIGKFNEQSPSIHDNYLHDNGDSPPNSAPSATGGSISPQYPIFSSTLSITAKGWSDPDGDPPGFRYQWDRKPRGSSTWTNITLATGSTLTGGFFGGDTIRCWLTPWDGEDTGPVVLSDEVVINNSAPSITSVSISPSPAYDNAALTAVPAGFSDPDFDTNQVFSYQWYNDTGIISGATSATLAPGNFKANDTVYCKVTPSDGQDSGSEVTSSSAFIVHYTDPGQGMQDQDGDGHADANDDFPYDDTQWRDTDGDGYGDNQNGNNPDNDIDGDGVNNTDDDFPLDKDEYVDSDGDGVGDNKDPDDDNDGYYDVMDDFPLNASEHRDTDSDGIGDNSDDDIDGDGVNNTEDDFDYDSSETTDSDGDGVGDNADADDDGGRRRS